MNQAAISQSELSMTRGPEQHRLFAGDMQHQIRSPRAIRKAPPFDASPLMALFAPNKLAANLHTPWTCTCMHPSTEYLKTTDHTQTHRWTHRRTKS